ncbi:MAG: CHAP domain-containing protein [Alphaproteobacteria bacterium]|nr:CHAP domain-containing protein [Alphaproteobacteria bacterium]
MAFWRGVAFLVLAVFGLSACASSPDSAAPALGRYDGSGARVVRTGNPQQCVPFAREMSGIAIRGDASTWWDQARGRYPRSNLPSEGAVLVLQGYSDERRGHVAVVTELLDERTIIVAQANWLNSGEISYGTPIMDVSANNDWSAVRVWHIPSKAWGRRIYVAKGFIYPFADVAMLQTSPQ